MKVDDSDLKKILRHLTRPDICASETYQELLRTPKIRQRLQALGFLKKPVGKREP